MKATLTVLFTIFTLFFSPAAFTADLTQIFAPHSPTSPEAAAVITAWLKANCKDLNWALAVTEIPASHQRCSRSVEQVHLSVELSHLTSHFIFWIREDDKGARVDWFNDEWPSWHICTAGESYYREDRTCKDQL